ncbi:MAG TPA: methionine synthase [Candidatus Aphodovivens avistercoris]|nr:methionine synthase [Candidatus Aphodovivens avistercoris]
MPDIAMRFHRDMLVLSAPLGAQLTRQGMNVENDLGYLILVEPEAVRDALRMEKVAGAQCLVAATEGVAPARLAHQGLMDRGSELAIAALRAIRPLRPQHLLAEVGPCGLPLDGSSKASLNENRAQYARAAHAFDGQELDALFLNGFVRADDLKCALMGVRQVTDAPVFASVTVDAEGLLSGGRAQLEDALAVMAEFGASVAGFETAAPLAAAERLARRAAAATDAPLLAQLHVGHRDPKQGVATDENPYYCADTMVEAATRLRAAGVQFLRATGDATPAYTGALAAATAGFDVVAPAAEER